MVEQSRSCHSHSHAVLVAYLDNVIVAYRTAGLSYVRNTALFCSFYVISEGEEGVRAERNSGYCSKVSLLFGLCKWLRLSREKRFPNTVS